MKYKIGCKLGYRLRTETTFIFNLQVARLNRHEGLSERLSFEPVIPVRRYEVPDTKNRYLGIVVPQGDLVLDYRAEVDLQVHRADPASIAEHGVADLPLEILPYLLPSRFIPSDRLAKFALAEFGLLPPGFGRVTAICNWIHDHLAYQPGSSDEQTTADESLLKRAGVCRDFSHLGIAFCRALNIPARFVSCYAFGLSPSDFHAVFEAYLSGRWWLFDATRQANLDGLVRIGVGRDAAEVAFSTPYGDMEATEMSVAIEHADGTAEVGARTTDAISVEEP